MLRITTAQVEALRTDALSSFEAAMLERCKELGPVHFAVLGEQGLLTFIRAAADRAAGHGFTFTGPLRLFIELSFLLGSSFDKDRQYPWAADCLSSKDPESQMTRAGALFERSKEALERIHGSDGGHRDAGLRGIQALMSSPPLLRKEDFIPVVLAEMERVYPEKYAYLTRRVVRSLIKAGQWEASRCGLSDPQDVSLIVLLMYAFGQGCLEDPLYPWIRRTLTSDTIATPSHRAGRLKEKALVWIRAVLADKGVRS